MEFIGGLFSVAVGVFGASCVVVVTILIMAARYIRPWLGLAQSIRVHPEFEAIVQAVREQMARSATAAASQNTMPNLRSRVRTQNDVTCPICLDTVKFAVETNCGHKLCGSCWIAYYDSQAPVVQALRCPVCRRDVNILFTYFTTDESAATENEEAKKAITHVDTYNRRFSGDPVPFIEQLRELPTFLRHFFREFFSFRGFFWMVRLRLFFCVVFLLLYVLAPLDFIPEAVFGLFGLTDDAFIVTSVAMYLNYLFRSFLRERFA